MKKKYLILATAILLLSLVLLSINMDLMAQDGKNRRIMNTGMVNPSANMKQLFGHIVLIETYDVSGFKGIHAKMELRDYKETIILLTKSKRLQTTLETALATGNLIFFWGVEWPDAPNPIGGTWLFKVYKPSVICIYDF